MKKVILGAAGFLGTNLVKKLVNSEDELVLFDIRSNGYIDSLLENKNVSFVKKEFAKDSDYNGILESADIVYHLISTTIPASNITLEEEINQNVIPTIHLLDECVKYNVKKIVFISSGGTVYGESDGRPFRENDETNPMCSYGIQKLMIEKYIQLYYKNNGLDYRIIRLANPFGPGQNPAGNLGAVTKFTYNIINEKNIEIFGDGSCVRDYIYIDDAINGIINISEKDTKDKIYNLGNGRGYSLKDIVGIIENISGKNAKVTYLDNRNVDINYSVLDVSRYTDMFKRTHMIGVEQGISLLIKYLEENKQKD